jgi:hypothetical protein
LVHTSATTGNRLAECRTVVGFHSLLFLVFARETAEKILLPVNFASVWEHVGPLSDRALENLTQNIVRTRCRETEHMIRLSTERQRTNLPVSLTEPSGLHIGASHRGLGHVGSPDAMYGGVQ